MANCNVAVDMDGSNHDNHSWSTHTHAATSVVHDIMVKHVM
jgi:hypothetical protein